MLLAWAVLSKYLGFSRTPAFDIRDADGHWSRPAGKAHPQAASPSAQPASGTEPVHGARESRHSVPCISLNTC